MSEVDFSTGITVLHDGFWMGTISKEAAATRLLLAFFIRFTNQDGQLLMTPENIAKFANLDEADVEVGLRRLQEPDVHSTSKGYEGRRIVSLGENRWLLPNKTAYKQIERVERKKAYDRAYKRDARGGEKPDVTRPDGMPDVPAAKPDHIPPPERNPELPTGMPNIPGSRFNPKKSATAKAEVSLDPEPENVPLPVSPPDVPHGTTEGETVPLGDLLPARFDPKAPAVHREPPPGACPKKKPEADMSRLPCPGERELALLAAALLNAGVLDATAQDAVDWIMQNDEVLGNRLRDKGMEALSEVGARSGKPMYDVIAQRYVAHRTGTRRDDE